MFRPFPNINDISQLAIVMNKKINIAIVGFGNIGSYFYKTLEKSKKAIAIKTGKITYC